jgi:EAL domain-containing protein (putative c-di-GMP-specific phosphodiesterase class I)/AmiR/NasT family two-component response regulator
MNINELYLFVIEDEDFQRMMIINMLKNMGAKSIQESSNGKHALEIMHGEKGMDVDIILCDINMPEMDGMEFLKHLAQFNQKAAVILLSALGSKILTSVENITKMFGIKVLGVIDKPLTPKLLESMLLKLIRIDNQLQKVDSINPFRLEEILHGLNNNEFEPYFQPKVNFESGKIIGVEALARWVHPELGVIEPFAFISMLEQSNYIDLLTFQMIEKAAIACRHFHTSGYELSMAINLSSVSLAKEAMAFQIIQAVKKAGIDSVYIIFEITEEVAMAEVPHVLENLTIISEHGFNISIDKFGTGFSNIQQLSRVYFNEFKIDQSIIKNFTEKDELPITIKKDIHMTHNLNVKCIAVGVETQQEWDMLKFMGCDQAQGFYIAKPMSMISFVEFYKKYPITIKV